MITGLGQMRLIPVFMIMLMGCAAFPHWQPGIASGDDTWCKPPDDAPANLVVRLRPGVDNAGPSILSCGEAWAFVLQAQRLAPLDNGWTILFTNGVTGVDANLNAHRLGELTTFPIAVTYPETRAIEVQAVNPRAVEHEFIHAQMIERGTPDPDHHLRVWPVAEVNPLRRSGLE